MSLPVAAGFGLVFVVVLLLVTLWEIRSTRPVRYSRVGIRQGRRWRPSMLAGASENSPRRVRASLRRS